MYTSKMEDETEAAPETEGFKEWPPEGENKQRPEDVHFSTDNPKHYTVLSDPIDTSKDQSFGYNGVREYLDGVRQPEPEAPVVNMTTWRRQEVMKLAIESTLPTVDTQILLQRADALLAWITGGKSDD